MPTIRPALQLYTVRELTKADFANAMREVSQIGYTRVELAGYGSLTSAVEAKKALDDADLTVVGAHIGIDRMEKELERVLDEQTILGNTNIICPHLGEPRRKDAAAWKQTAASMNKIAATCKRQGFEFAYHNHSWEFQTFDGVSGFDLLWQNTDPDLVKSELDVYWIQHGGVDPTACIKKMGKRILALHLKDMAAGPERRFAPVGSGLLDFNAMLKAALALGINYYIVEQDATYETPPLQAARTSLDNLRKLGFV